MDSSNPLVTSDVELEKEDEQLRLQNFHNFIVEKLGNLAPSLIEHNILPQVWVALTPEDQMLFQNVNVLSIGSQTELVQRILNTIGKIFNDMCHSVSSNTNNLTSNVENEISFNMANSQCDSMNNVINLSSESLNYNNASNFLNNNSNNIISKNGYNNLNDRIIINVNNSPNNLATLSTPISSSALQSYNNYTNLLDSTTLFDPSLNSSNASFFSNLIQNNVVNSNIINSNSNNVLINNQNLVNNPSLLNNFNQYNIINNNSNLNSNFLNNTNNANFNLINNPMTIELFQSANNQSSMYQNQLVKNLVNSDNNNSQLIINTNQNNISSNILSDNTINNESNTSSYFNNNILQMDIKIPPNKEVEPGEKVSTNIQPDSFSQGDNFELFESQLLLGLGLPDLGSVIQKTSEDGSSGEFEVKALRSSLKEKARQIKKLQLELSKVYVMLDQALQENASLKKQQNNMPEQKEVSPQSDVGKVQKPSENCSVEQDDVFKKVEISCVEENKTNNTSSENQQIKNDSDKVQKKTKKEENKKPEKNVSDESSATNTIESVEDVSVNQIHRIIPIQTISQASVTKMKNENNVKEIHNEKTCSEKSPINESEIVRHIPIEVVEGPLVSSQNKDEKNLKSDKDGEPSETKNTPTNPSSNEEKD